MSRDLIPEVQRVKTYQPIKWNGSHRRVVALEAAGYRPGEIAEITGLTPSRVSIILNDPRADLDRKQFARKVVDRVQDVQLQIALHAEEALEEIVDEMRTSTNEQIRQKASLAILDRAGYTPIRKELKVEAQVPQELIGAMQEVLSEIEAIEADYEIVPVSEAEEIE